MNGGSAGQRILVIGSGGGVGRRVCAEVERQCGPGVLVLGDYRLERAQIQAREFPGAMARWIDLRDTGSILDAISPDIGSVIVCTMQEQPDIQISCLEKGVPCLDVTIGQELTSRIHDLDESARKKGIPLLTMAGMWPALSGLMAMRATQMLDNTDMIDLGLCQNTRSSVGPTGLVDMLKAFSTPVVFHEGGEQREVPGFSIQRRFEYPHPMGTYKHRLVNFVEGPALSEVLGVSGINLWTGFNSAAFDGMLSALRRVGILGLFQSEGFGLRLGRAVNALKDLGPAGPEPTSIVVEARGEKDGRPALSRISLVGPSDYGVTAMSSVAFARLLASRGEGAAGAGPPLRHFLLQEVLDTIDHPDLEVVESEPAAAE